MAKYVDDPTPKQDPAHDPNAAVAPRPGHEFAEASADWETWLVQAEADAQYTVISDGAAERDSPMPEEAAESSAVAAPPAPVVR